MKYLYEVTIIRPLIIFLLIVFHCLCVYNGKWDAIESIGNVPFYYWIANFISGIQLEAMAFISGYVYSFQMNELKRQSEFKSLVIKKFKRLLIPCYFFSILYYVLILRHTKTYSYEEIIYLVSNGAGHLWFLPMLFWCFVLLYFVHKYIKSNFKVLIALAFVSILPSPYLPLGIGRVFHFMFYAYAGYYLWLEKARIINLFMNKRYWLCCIYVVLLYFSCIIENMEISNFEISLLFKVIVRLLKLFLATIGILALYLIVYKYLLHKEKLAHSIIYINSICYGLYIFHQFFLKYLYYQTDLPAIVGSIYLPWVGLLIALPCSYMLTYILLKNKYGRMLIG